MDLFIWTPVIAGYATLKEVQEDWSLYDILDCFEAMQIKADLEKILMPKIKVK